jgi:hypothetical protein
MMIKKNLLSAVLFLFFAFVIFAQANETGGVDFTLDWEADEYAWNYEVTVEKRKAGLAKKYTEILRQKTEQAEIPCSLTTGRYRYQVIAYDFFGRASAISEWSYFEVIPGQPVTIEKTKTVKLAAPKQPKNDGEDPDSSPASLLKKPWDFFATVDYLPLVSLPTSDFNRLYKGFLPGSVSARAAAIPFDFRVISLGFELAPSWAYLSVKENTYSVYSQLLNLHLGLVGELWLPNNTMAFNFHLGGGMTLLYDFHLEYAGQKNQKRITTWIPSMYGGVSFAWLFRKPFFAEAGVELLHLFSADKVFLGFIRPSLGVGVRF